MSNFIQHEPCPHCGSRDNLGVYDDGHKYCFGCGYVERGTGINLLTRKEKKHDRVIGLPFDCSSTLPVEPAKTWLDRYEIADNEIFINKFQWSESKQMLVMPIYDVYGNLLMWQGRRFGVEKRSRYHNEGNVETVYHIMGYANPDKIVVVEDMISAIKVSRVATVMPLLGSSISSDRLVHLAKRFEGLVMWLDYDKAKYMAGTSLSARLLFESVQTVLTKKDPKEHSTEAIKSLLEKKN